MTESSECELDVDEESMESLPPSFISRLAFFGDSGWSVVASFAMLFVAAALSYVLDDSVYARESSFPSLGPVPEIDPPRIFAISHDGKISDEIRSAFRKDGVVAIRGLLSEEDIQKLDRASSVLMKEQKEEDSRRKRNRQGTQFYTVRQGAIFRSSDGATEGGGNDVASVFREIALLSAIPKVAADLLNLKEDRNDTMRLMRDIFLAKDEEQYICGWHVDDITFWPCTADAPGINAWIAIDDIPVDRGGGFALAVGSHAAPWREEAHRVTGSTWTLPREGFRDAADMVANRTGSGTCNMKTAAPHIHKRMEDTKRIYNVQAGDVILHTRWLFHRTVPFDLDARDSDEDAMRRAYSLRYSPGSSRIPPGYGLEPSVLWNEENAGRTADEVALKDGPWYPLCWPVADENEMEDLSLLVEKKIPIADERRQLRRRELQPYLNKMAKDKGGGQGRQKSQH